MPLDLLPYYLNVPVLMLVFSRLGAMIMFQPILAATSVPMMVRMLLVLALSLIVTPLIAPQVVAPTTLVGLVLAIGREVLIGGTMGLIMATLFLSLQIGGQLIAQESGLAFGRISDPNSGIDVDVLSSVYLQLGTVLFLLVGGHRVVVRICLDSFEAAPVAAAAAPTLAGTQIMVAVLQFGLEAALRIAGPVVIVLFLVNLAMGFVSRTFPQFNILTVGFTLKALLVFIFLAAALPAGADVFLEGVTLIVETLPQLFEPA